MAIRYLLDEHLNPAYRSQLVRQEPELVVRIIGDLDAPPKGALDPAILIWCETNGFILVTNNRKSMPKHLADHLALSRHIPGIFTIDNRAYDFRKDFRAKNISADSCGQISRSDLVG